MTSGAEIPTAPGAHEPRLPGFRNFFRTEAAGAVVLLVVAVTALLLANLPATREMYAQLLHEPIVIVFGDWHFKMDFAEFVDEFLMALFFLVIGLEIKREIIVGELSSVRRAILPIIAALGGMLVPALIYLAVNHGDPATAKGWGVPMATDIAFALGVLALVGKRAPSSMRVFLAALAIADDIGAILVIAIFYSSGISLWWLLLAAVIVAALIGLGRLGVDNVGPYLLLGLLLWFAVLNSGLHSTIAGVILAFTIPTKARVAPVEFTAWARRVLDRIEAVDDPDAHPLVDDAQQLQAFALTRTAKQVASPLQRMEFALHPYTTYLILPLFALFNAGVKLPPEGFAVLLSPVALGVMLGLVIGKPIGIISASWVTVKLRLADLPAGMGWRQVSVVGVLAGIGFTMAIFVANLAFPASSPHLAEAKLAILVTSVVAGALGALALRTLCPVCTLPDE